MRRDICLILINSWDGWKISFLKEIMNNQLLLTNHIVRYNYQKHIIVKIKQMNGRRGQ